MSRRAVAQLALLMIALIALSALDYIVFMVRQRRGDVMSYVSVRQYMPVADGRGHYQYDYVGRMDVPCVMALLPHQRTSPCWWTKLHSGHYE